MKGLTPLVLIVISVIALFFYVYPKYQDIQAKRVEASEYEGVVSRAQELKQLRETLASTLSTFPQEDLDKLSVMIPEKVDTGRLILDVSGVASRYGIEMKDIKVTDPPPAEGKAVKPGETKVGKPYKTSTISFTFQTSYEGMLQFAQDLERSLRLMDVLDISLAPSTSKFPIYNYTMTLQTYWLN